MHVRLGLSVSIEVIGRFGIVHLLAHENFNTHTTRNCFFIPNSRTVYVSYGRMVGVREQYANIEEPKTA